MIYTVSIAIYLFALVGVGIYKTKMVNKNEINKFVNFLVNSLDQIGFLQPDHKRKSMIQNIRVIFNKMNLSDKEMRILLGIFSSLKDRKA